MISAETTLPAPTSHADHGAQAALTARSTDRLTNQTPPRRARLLARISKIWRWEFWPSHIFYLPMIPVWLALVLRHRSLTCWTAVNPMMPHGGVVGEHKHAILSALTAADPDATLATIYLPASTPDRAAFLHAQMRERSLDYPLILKPDIGERGTGVRIARNDAAAGEILAANAGIDLIAQPYHPGPHECGVFYIRHPRQPHGHIFSITAKRFPTVTGDGTSTLHDLIWADARLRMQAGRFLTRLGPRSSHVPAHGEIVTLAIAGNHCQGTLFADGSHMITPELTARIDAIARALPGFFFGRFDIRYSDETRFRRGEDLAILELNGVTSESTNIYDPRRSLLAAYITLTRQWSAAFAIGKANLRAGLATPTSARELLRLIRHHSSRPQANAPAD